MEAAMVKEPVAPLIHTECKEAASKKTTDDLGFAPSGQWFGMGVPCLPIDRDHQPRKLEETVICAHAKTIVPPDLPFSGSRRFRPSTRSNPHAHRNSAERQPGV